LLLFRRQTSKPFFHRGTTICPETRLNQPWDASDLAQERADVIVKSILPARVDKCPCR
jgi:hypothetical protein